MGLALDYRAEHLDSVLFLNEVWESTSSISFRRAPRIFSVLTSYFVKTL
jgi:hypothetical protein